MKQNDHAVSPVIGVMLMIVVTIIVAAVVSAFAGSTDFAKRAGPSVTLGSETMYNSVSTWIGTSWTATTHHDAEGDPAYMGVDCLNDQSDTCYNYFDAHVGEPGCDFNSCYYQAQPAYDTTVNDRAGFNGNTGSNNDGLLFTHEGGDPIDMKDLELTVRYFNLQSSVFGTDTKRYVGVDRRSSRPSYASIAVPPTGDASTTISNVVVSTQADYDKAIANSVGSSDPRYFIKLNEMDTNDTIIRSGDQFEFLVDHQILANSLVADYEVWALSSNRAGYSDADPGASIAFNARSGETEWWLVHAPSGATLAHGTFEAPRT